MKEEIWKSIAEFVKVSKYPHLPCPYCGVEHLGLDAKSLQVRPLPDSYKEVASRHFKDLEAEKLKSLSEKGAAVKDVFETQPLLGFLIGLGAVATELQADIENMAQSIAFFQCGGCQASVSAVGLAKVYRARTGEQPKQETEVKFEYFTPSIPMIPLSKHLPREIKVELLDAFKHYHFDPPSAASKLRRAIEKFCQSQGAKGTNLHRQIDSLKATLPLEAQYLEALKLVGNEGTHSNGVDEGDLLLAFKVIQYVLEFFDRKKRFEETMPDYEKIQEKFNSQLLGSDPVKV